jgi:signal transduction histidine kinase
MVIPVTQAPSEEWLEEATQICRIFNHSQDWKSSLNQAIPLIRKLIIFDNLVIYHVDPSGQNLTLDYARATGRGRSQGAEITWGEPFARRVISNGSPLIEQSKIETVIINRLEKPIMLGIPYELGNSSIGVIVFIRFGSPFYDDPQVQIAEWVVEQVKFLLNRRDIFRRLEVVEEERKQAQFQEDFVSTITHELRTPLGFIKGYTTTLLRPDTEWNTKNRNEFLTIIDQETDKLQELIDNILDTARLQSGTMPISFQRMRIEPTIRDVKNRIETQHPGIQVECQLMSETLPIEGDPIRLAQVFGNLIINAIKYAPDASIIIQTRQRAEGVTIVIKDTGPGIPPEELPHIFERFYRGAGSRAKHGSGLGLYICKQIIRSHHGRITVDSSPGKGTKFIIHLPYKQPATKEVP